MKLKSFSKKLNLGLISRFASEFINRGSSLITFPLMVRFLSVEAYGVNTQIQTLTNFLITLSGLGMGFFVIRELSGDIDYETRSKKFRSTVLLVVFASTLFSLGFILLPDLVNHLFFKVPWATNLIQYSAGIVIATAIEQVAKDYLRARLHMVAYSVAQIVQSLALILGISLILFSGGGVLELVLLTIGIKVLSIIIITIFLCLVGEVQLFGSFIKFDELLLMIKWGIPIVASGLSISIISTGDRAVLGALTNASLVAIYGASYQLASVLLALGSPFWSMLYPLLANFKNSFDRPGLSKTSRKYSNGFSILGFPGLFGLMALGPIILKIIGEKSYDVSSIAFALICLGIFISQFCSPFLYMAYLYSKPRSIFLVTLISALINIIMNLLLIPFLGILAPAIITCLTYAMMDLFFCKMLKRNGFLEEELFDYHQLGKYIIASLIMFLFIIVINEFIIINTIAPLLMLIGGSVLVYCISLLFEYHFKISEIIGPFAQNSKS